MIYLLVPVTNLAQILWPKHIGFSKKIKKSIIKIGMVIQRISVAWGSVFRDFKEKIAREF
jgi:hypothetical protein